MPEPIRSFIAFDINNQEILKRLTEVQEKLAKSGADLKLVEPQNIHVTMRFLGDIQPSMVDKIHSEMEQAVFTPFNVEIRGVGAFPNTKYARVVWAGIKEGADGLKDIFNQIEPRLRHMGLRPDSKGFSPHLTIARVRSGRNKNELANCIDELANHQFGTLRADCLRLKKSTLTPKGPVYSTLKEVCPK
ncbi:MAG: RNA 2',3'-cyclic phosphodiesterase [Candidatus Bathyarchaeia archaeon]